MTENLDDFGRGVPSVSNPPAVEPHRPLTEREWAILGQAGAENDTIIFDALRLFDSRVVE